MIYDKKSEINDLHTVFLLIIIIFYKKTISMPKGRNKNFFYLKLFIKKTQWEYDRNYNAYFLNLF